MMVTCVGSTEIFHVIHLICKETFRDPFMSSFNFSLKHAVKSFVNQVHCATKQNMMNFVSYFIVNQFPDDTPKSR